MITPKTRSTNRTERHLSDQGFGNRRRPKPATKLSALPKHEQKRRIEHARKHVHNKGDGRGKYKWKKNSSGKLVKVWVKKGGRGGRK